MTRTVNVAFTVMLGAGIFALPSALAKEYATTNAWFSISSFTEVPKADGTVTGADTGCGIKWTAVPTTDCVVSEGKIAVDTDAAANPLTLAPVDAGDDGYARFTTKVTLSSSETAPTTNQKIGLCLVESDNGAKWNVRNNGAWVEQTTSTVPEMGAEYEITLETDVQGSKVRWLAKKVDGTEYELTTDWISVSDLTAQISKVSYFGSTFLASAAATIVRSITIDDTADGSQYKVIVIDGAKDGASIFVDESSEWWTNYKSTVGGDSATKANMNTTAANGLTYLQDYVLGLDPTTATKKPLVSAKQNDKTNKITFKPDGITLNAKAGARVKYRVKYCDKPDFSGATFSESSAMDKEIELDLPSTETKVKYYKVVITID